MNAELPYRVELFDATKHMSGPTLVKMAESCAMSASPDHMSHGEFGFSHGYGLHTVKHVMFMREAAAQSFAKAINEALGIVLNEQLQVTNPLGAEEFTLEIGDKIAHTRPSNAENCSLLNRLYGQDQETACSEINDGFESDDPIAEIESAAHSSGISLLRTRRTTKSVTYQAIDTEKLEWYHGMDVSSDLHEAGYPLRMQAKLLRDGRICAANPDGTRATPANREITRCEAGKNATAAIKSAFPNPKDVICDFQGLLKAYGCESPSGLAKTIYKGYSCGPWISAIPQKTDGQGFGTTPLSNTTPNDHAWSTTVRGVLVGSIVEGSDAEVESQPIYFPMTKAQLDSAIQWVNDQVEELWSAKNKCSERSAK